MRYFISLLITTLLLALFTGCETMPVNHQEDSLRNGQCLSNSKKFKAAYDEQIGGWSRIILVSYWADEPRFQGVQMAARRGRDTALTRHAIVACEYKGKIWIYDDAVIGSPYPLGGVTLRDKNNPHKIAYWTRQPNFKTASWLY